MQGLKPYCLDCAIPYHRSLVMPKAVSRMLTLLCALVVSLPVGTNLGLLHLLWMLVSGRLLATRGAVIPGLDACDLSRRAVRRAWAARGSPLGGVRARGADAGPGGAARPRGRGGAARGGGDGVVVGDAGFPLRLLQGEGARRFVVPRPKKAPSRRATPPAYHGRGRPPT